MPVTGQVVVRRALGRRLMRLRMGSGKNRKDVVDAKLGISEATLSRIETGKGPVTGANVRALCWLYGVDQSTTDALAELAVGTSQEEWWDSSPLIPEWFKLYMGLEVSARRICSYEGEIIPGELQTEDYAQAVYAAAAPGDDEGAERHVKLRIQRQGTMFARKPPPQLQYVLGEGALTRLVGGADVMQGQIAHVRKTAKLAHVEVRVLPWSVGAHAAMASAFRILDFDDPEDPDVVYIESHLGAVYLEEPAELAAYRAIFDLIHAQSIPIAEFRT
jgi:hypothetical protein